MDRTCAARNETHGLPRQPADPGCGSLALGICSLRQVMGIVFACLWVVTRRLRRQVCVPKWKAMPGIKATGMTSFTEEDGGVDWDAEVPL